MTVFVAWSDAVIPADLDGSSNGPWREVRRVEEHLVLVDSTESLSRVFHAVKWELPDDAALLVTPCDGAPKIRYLPSGTQSWLRARAVPGT
ncbi:hypothetical protein KLP28_07370 [Nocardioidaceae bacterium]|nr:hypothetical protein KLP28_07370 [Nocardioidaceae bacterium]